MQAGRLLEQRVSQSEVARRLGVHRQSVIRWARQLAQSLRAGVKKAGGGVQAQAQPIQLGEIEQGLKRRSEALRYATGAAGFGRGALQARRAVEIRQYLGE